MWQMNGVVLEFKEQWLICNKRRLSPDEVCKSCIQDTNWWSLSLKTSWYRVRHGAHAFNSHIPETEAGGSL